MGFSNQATQQQFPFSASTVFSALKYSAIDSGMTVKESDSVLFRATINVGASLLSWGETISVSIMEVDSNSCIITLNSSLKFSLNLTGAHKHQENFDKLLYSLSRMLNNVQQKDNTIKNHDKDVRNEGRLEGLEPNFVLISVAIVFVVIMIAIYAYRL